MNDKIRTHLTAYALTKGWTPDEQTLFEIVREGKRIWEEKTRSHRWYDDLFCVTEIDGMLIGFDDFYMTGDNSASDMGLDYDYSSLCEVEPVQKTITVYQKKP